MTRPPLRVIDGGPRPEPRREPPSPAAYIAAAGLVSAIVGVSILAAWSAWWVRP